MRLERAGRAASMSLVLALCGCTNAELQERAVPPVGAEAPAWAVPFGKEPWRRVAAQDPVVVAPGAKAVESPAFADAMERVRHAISARPPIAEPYLESSRYRVAFTSDGVEYTPAPAFGAPGSEPATLRTRGASYGSWWVVGNTAQILADRRTGAVEHYEARSDGIELTWILASGTRGGAPAVFEVEVEGYTAAAADERGVTFAARDGSGRFAVKDTEAVDAAGRRWPLRVTEAPSGFRVEVPAAVIAAAAFPLAVDPTIGPEQGLDDPLWGYGGAETEGVDVAAITGAFFVVWSDFRGVTTSGQDLWGARVSAADGSLLDPEGIRLTSAPDNERWPVIAANGDDLFIVWDDDRFGVVSTHVYGARIDGAAGTCADPEGIPIFPASGAQSEPRVASYGDGWFVVWKHDPETWGSAEVVMAARVGASDGAVLDAEPIELPSPGGDVDVASNGSELLVAWMRCLSEASCTTKQVVAMRVDGSTGASLDAEPALLRTGGETIVDVRVASNGTDFLVVWEDSLLGADIFASRVAADGTVLDIDPIVVVSEDWEQGAPAVESNGDGYYVAWRDNRDTGDWSRFDVYGARVTALGELLDPGGDLLVSTDQQQDLPAVASDGDGYYVAWSDARHYYPLVYGTRVGADGTVLEPGGALVSYGSNNQSFPAAASNGDVFLVAFSDYRSYPSSDRDIYAVRLSAADLSILDPAGIAITTAPEDQTEASVASNGTDFFVVWADERNEITDDEIYGARVDGVTGAVLDPGGVPVSLVADGGWGRMSPDVASNGADYFVAWSDNRWGYDVIYGARVAAADGEVLDPSGQLLSSGGDDTFWPAKIASNGDNYLVVWRQCESEVVDGALVDAISGDVVASIPTLDSVGTQSFSMAVASAGGDYLAALAVGITTGQVRGRRLDGETGAPLDPAPIAFVTPQSVKNGLSAASNGDYYVLVWLDGYDPPYQIRGTAVSLSGVSAFPEGFALADSEEWSSYPEIEWAGGDDFLVTFHRMEDGVRRVRALRLSFETCDVGGDSHVEGAFNPENPCERCDPAASADAWTPVPDGDACDDGLWCTVGDVCADGECAVEPRECPDPSSQLCQIGACDEEADSCGTVTSPDGYPCDDVDSCTVDDACSSGVCAGSEMDCSEMDGPCEVGVCEQAACDAELLPVGSPCDDGDPDTVDDTCHEDGTCEGSPGEGGCGCAEVGFAGGAASSARSLLATLLASSS